MRNFLEASLYLTAVPWIISRLWLVSLPNTLGKIVKEKFAIDWNWLPEVYQILSLLLMGWALWRPPGSRVLLTVLVAFAWFRPAEILVFCLHWVLVRDPVVHVRRSLIGFVVNQTEIVLSFAVLFRHFGCGMDGPGAALYNSLRTAVTIGPNEDLKGCYRLVSAEIVVAYLLTVLVIAAVVGKVARNESSPKEAKK
jgi:hypothetical protein